MSLKCSLGMHVWEEEKCTQCGKEIDNAIRTKLFRAIKTSDLERVRSALKAGAPASSIATMSVSMDNDDYDDTEDFTPFLVLAVRTGNVAIVELLLEKGADINAGNVRNWTALMSAAWHGNIEIVNLLLSRNANVNAKSHGSIVTALAAAATNGHIEVVKRLLENGADPDIQDSIGRTARTLAKHPEIIAILKK